MGTVKEKLEYLKATKAELRAAVIAKGVSVPEEIAFRGYSEKIAEIPSADSLNEELKGIIGDPSVTINLTECLAETKEAIRSAITEKAVDLPSDTPFPEYAEKIRSISTTPTEKIGHGYFDADMLYCIERINHETALSGAHKLLVMTYDNAGISFKVGGPDGIQVKTCEGDLYESSDQTALSDQTHIWKDANCPDSLLSGQKLYWFIIASSHRKIAQDLPKGKLVYLKDCELNLACLKNYTEACYLGASEDSAYLREGEADAVAYTTLQCVYLENATLDENAYGSCPPFLYFQSKGGCIYSYYDVTSPYLEAAYLSEDTIIQDSEYLFGGCSYLKKVHIGNFSYNPSMATTFYNCYSLSEITFKNTFQIDYMADTFYECHSLTIAPVLDTSQVDSMAWIFYNNHSLKIVPLYDTSNVKNMDDTFRGCGRLEYLPAFDTSKVNSMCETFFGCGQLKEIPAFNVEKVNEMLDMLVGCRSLEKIHMVNIGTSLDISASTKFTAEALIEIINHLKTVSGETLTMGASNLAKLTVEQKAIATNKGWTLA